MKFTAKGLKLHAEGDQMVAVFEAGRLMELTDKASGKRLLSANAEVPPLELIHMDGQLKSIGAGQWVEAHLEMLGPGVAQYWLSDWEADACIRISWDGEHRELLVEPSVTTARDGVGGVRWNISGIDSELRLVAPFYQGTRLLLNDDLLQRRRWNWPLMWEAAFAVLEGKDGAGFYCMTLDRQCRYKSLHTGHEKDEWTLGFDTENYGPWEGKKEAGGLVWRIGVFEGGWQTPAARYRTWLWDNYPLAEAANRRPKWASQITLAISWCPCKLDILGALAKRNPPHKTLLHVPSWRSFGYDENYPEYEPSEEGRKFIEAALAQGFHVMPHFNFFCVDPSHPLYRQLQDYQIRDVHTRRLDGWSWVEHHMLGNPQSHAQLPQHRKHKVMGYLHTGLSRWRRELASRIAKAARELKLDAVFVDQTLCTWNCLNALVENMSPTEGMWNLTRELTEIGPGLSVGGEGLNEVSMQWQSFAQAHLFDSHHGTRDGLERVACPVGHFLYGDLCRTIGYSGLNGKDAASALRMSVHRELKTIPTLTIGSAEEIQNPNAAVAEELERAAASQS